MVNESNDECGNYSNPNKCIIFSCEQVTKIGRKENKDCRVGDKIRKKSRENYHIIEGVL